VKSSSNAATADTGDIGEVEVLDPAYLKASEGGDGDMPDAPAEFVEGEFDMEAASLEGNASLEGKKELDEPNEETGDPVMQRKARSIDNGTSTVSEGTCKAYCDTDTTTTWEKKCNWVKCTGCDECDGLN